LREFVCGSPQICTSKGDARWGFQTKGTLDMRLRMTSLFLLSLISFFSFVLAAQNAARHSGSSREQLVGSWHLVSVDEPGLDGKIKHVSGRTGQLIYTRDGHMSVQLMYPTSEPAVSNDYVLNGYEASFGSYDIDESAHTVTHHVQASITRGLIGKRPDPRISAFKWQSDHQVGEPR
jgi:hypothetical protein